MGMTPLVCHRYGMLEHATTENSLAVLDETIKNHGKPASVMTNRGPQFYASASEAKKKGAPAFEKRLVNLGIRQILQASGTRRQATSRRCCTGRSSTRCRNLKR